MSPFDNAFVLTGPTGSGKSALALALAERIGAEIVSMDSMTLYRGMDIGTAKPSLEERRRIPHHLIDELDPWESAHVAWWLDQSRLACESIRSRGRHPLFVGGTPFYLMALQYGLFDAPPSNETVRQRIEAEIAECGAEAIHAKLTHVDPVAAKRIHANDTRRLVRALEVFELTGRPLSSFQQTWDTPGFHQEGKRTTHSLRIVRLDWPRDVLYSRIDRRVVAMIEAGWREECGRLAALPHPLSREAAAAIGYRELLAERMGSDVPADQTVSLIQMKTRQFAKRQLTWFRRMSAPVLDLSTVPESEAIEWILGVWLSSGVELNRGNN